MDQKRGTDRVVEAVVNEIEKALEKGVDQRRDRPAPCAGGPHVRMTPRCRLRASVAIYSAVSPAFVNCVAAGEAAVIGAGAASVGGELSSGSSCGWIDLRSWTAIALVK
jgi:hypothetical protein